MGHKAGGVVWAGTMKLGTLGVLLGIAALSTAYVSALAWLAWVWYRRTGRDGFENVVSFVAGIAVVHWLSAGRGASAALSVLSGTVAASLVSAVLLRWAERTEPADRTGLVGPIVVASIALLLLDALTSHTPVALLLIGAAYPWLLLSVAVVLILTIGLVLGSRYGAVLRLGQVNRWAVSAWCRPQPKPTIVFQLSLTLAWGLVIAIPLITTGVLTSTILRDTTLALLLARVAGPGRQLAILGTAATLASLRTATGFVFVGTAGPPLVEATIFVAILLWLRVRSFRTPWGNANAG